jgi:hypothetical protein
MRVSGSAMSPATLRTSGSSDGSIVRALVTTASPVPVAGDEPGADALGALR